MRKRRKGWKGILSKKLCKCCHKFTRKCCKRRKRIQLLKGKCYNIYSVGVSCFSDVVALLVYVRSFRVIIRRHFNKQKKSTYHIRKIEFPFRKRQAKQVHNTYFPLHLQEKSGSKAINTKLAKVFFKAILLPSFVQRIHVHIWNI